MILLIAQAAHAAVVTLDYSWPIRRDTAPTWAGLTVYGGAVPPGGGVVQESLVLGDGDVLGFTEPVGEQPTDWPRVKIDHSGNGRFVASFEARTDQWPSAAEWNAHPVVSASYTVPGGDTYVVRLTITARQDEGRAGGSWDVPSNWTPTTGIPFVFKTSTFVRPGPVTKTLTTDFSHADRVLPQASYVDGCVQAQVGASPWTGVDCCVTDDGAGIDWLRVEVHPNGTEYLGANGKCVLPKVGGGTLAVTGITLDRP